MSDPAYAPFTPPYFYGESTARISFEPYETRKYSLMEILDDICKTGGDNAEE